MPVGNGCHTAGFHVGQGPAQHRRDVRWHPKIAMTAGLRNHGSTWIDSRTFCQSSVDGTFQGKGISAHVSHRSEAPHQLFFGRMGRKKTDEGNLRNQSLLQRHGLHHGMDMRIDQTRHEKQSLSVDDRYVRQSGHIDRISGNLADQMILNQYIPLKRLLVDSVENLDVANQYSLLGGCCHERNEQSGKEQ